MVKMFSKIKALFTRKADQHQAAQRDIKVVKGKPAPDGIDMEALERFMQEAKDREDRAEKTLEVLGIHCTRSSFAGINIPMVNAVELVKILEDEKKLKEISSKIKLKAFW
jgi:hypothetical protein